MSWGDLLRYILLIAVCLGALGLILYVIRGAIQKGKAAELMREVAGVVIEIRAAAQAKKVEVTKGKEVALKAVEAKFTKEVEALDEEQKEQAKELQNNPAALSRFLVRAGRRTKSS